MCTGHLLTALLWRTYPRSGSTTVCPVEEFEAPKPICIEDVSDDVSLYEDVDLEAADSTKKNSIVIEDRKHINAVKLYDCLSITIHNCPLLKNIPEIGHFRLLENLFVSHIDMAHFHLQLPETLTCLHITYCNLQEFRPANIVNLVELNLSFNKLKEIPICVDDFQRVNPNMRIALRNNDFWFDMYSNLPYSMISPATISELLRGNRVGLVGIQKLRYAVESLRQKNFEREAQELARVVNIRLEEHAQNDPTTHYDKQNVHLTSVQKSFRESLRYVMTYISTKDYQGGLNGIIKALQCDRDTEAQVRMSWDLETRTADGVVYKDVLLKVYQIINDENDREKRQCMLDVLRSEIKDSIKTCFTGQITRIVNALGGFNEHVKIGISKNEEIANSIVAIRKKYAIMYPDSEQYVTECIPVVWQMLEDNCVPEPEHGIWLEYV